MAINKTHPTHASVENYLAAIDDEDRRQDCVALVKLMTRVTKQEPKMWGTAIVGFGSLKYKYESGREGETCLLGFSSRKSDISVYGTGSAPRRLELLALLGKHKVGKGCLYLGRLKDVDGAVLQELLSDSIAARST